MSPREHARIVVPASAATLRSILLDPSRLADWNPAFLAITAPSTPAIDQDYPILVRPGFRGVFRYGAIDASEIETRWSMPGLSEVGLWRFGETLEGTVVEHVFDHTGPLAQALRNAFRGVASLRLDRLARQARLREPGVRPEARPVSTLDSR